MAGGPSRRHPGHPRGSGRRSRPRRRLCGGHAGGGASPGCWAGLSPRSGGRLPPPGEERARQISHWARRARSASCFAKARVGERGAGRCDDVAHELEPVRRFAARNRAVPRTARDIQSVVDPADRFATRRSAMSAACAKAVASSRRAHKGARPVRTVGQGRGEVRAPPVGLAAAVSAASRLTMRSSSNRRRRARRGHGGRKPGPAWWRPARAWNWDALRSRHGPRGGAVGPRRGPGPGRGPLSAMAGRARGHG